MLASQSIITAMQAALVAAATTSAARIYTDRFWPISTYPATRLLHVDEDLQATDDDITWPAVRLHRLQVDVQVSVQAEADLDTTMSDAAQQVLQALEGAATPLAPLNVALQATGIRYQAQTDGAAATGQATVRFEALFHTAANDPTTVI